MNSSIKLVFFSNPQREAAVQGLHNAIDLAQSMGCKCYVSKELKDTVGFDAEVFDPSIKPDFVLAFGGDGTILRTADVAMHANAPILGINFGRIGFLSEIDPAGFKSGLDRLLNGDYTLDKRTMLCCRVNGAEPHYFLNEALLYKRSFSGVADISFEIDGMNAGSILCDGIIASTSTGATGYSVSAGGPVVAPGLDALIITPICPHTLATRPIVAGTDTMAKFSMKSAGYLSVDGIYTCDIDVADEISVYKDGSEVSFVRFAPQNLYELIRKKLS